MEHYCPNCNCDIQDEIDSYIDEHVYEIIRQNRDAALEVLKP